MNPSRSKPLKKFSRMSQATHEQTLKKYRISHTEVSVEQVPRKWGKVSDVVEATRLGESTVRKMLIPLLRNPRRVKGKLRHYKFFVNGTKRGEVRVVWEDVEALMPDPEDILSRQRTPRMTDSDVNHRCYSCRKEQ
jgi:hypothetical protein